MALFRITIKLTVLWRVDSSRTHYTHTHTNLTRMQICRQLAGLILVENVSCEEPAERKEGTGRNETKRNQNELKQNEECAWLSEKSANVWGEASTEWQRGGGGKKTSHTVDKNLKMQINVSWPFSFLFLPLFLLLASSFFLALLLRCHVTNSSREVCYFLPSYLPPSCPLSSTSPTLSVSAAMRLLFKSILVVGI